MKAQTSLEIVADKGISGDAAFERTNRQILLISNEILTEYDLNPGDLRENILVEGLDLDSLPAGTTIIIGTTHLSITGPCNPCGRLDELRKGLQGELLGRRGVLARALTDGQISIGDSVEVSLP
jgi:MOSC domain-containing protein YiiM